MWPLNIDFKQGGVNKTRFSYYKFNNLFTMTKEWMNMRIIGT